MSTTSSYCFYNNTGTSEYGVKLNFVGVPGILQVLSGKFLQFDHHTSGSNEYARGWGATVNNATTADLTVVTIEPFPNPGASYWLTKTLGNGGPALRVDCRLFDSPLEAGDPLDATAVLWQVTNPVDPGGPAVYVPDPIFGSYLAFHAQPNPSVTADYADLAVGPRHPLIPVVNSTFRATAGGGDRLENQVKLPPHASASYRVVIGPARTDRYLFTVIAGRVFADVEDSDILCGFASQSIVLR